MIKQGAMILQKMKSTLAVLLIISLSFVISQLFFTFFPDIQSGLKNQIFDAFYQLRYRVKGKEKVSADFIIMNVDDNFSREYLKNDGTRIIWAKIVDLLCKAEVKTLVFDILFRDDREDTADRELVATTGAGNRVFFPVSLAPTPPDGPDVTLQILSDKFFWSPGIEMGGNPLSAESFSPPFYALADSAAGLGTIFLTPDGDGISRQIPLVIAYEDKYIPSLVLAGVCHYLNVLPENVKISFGKFIKLTDASPYGEKIDFWIPIDSQGRMRINYAGPWADSIEMYAMTDLLLFADKNRGKLDKTLPLRDTLVIVADVTNEKNDFSRGIFESPYPKSAILANAINTILTQNYLSEPGAAQKIIIICFIILLLWLGSGHLKFGWFALLSIPFLLIFYGINAILFITTNRLPSLLLPTLGTLFSFLGIAIYKYITLAGKNNGGSQAPALNPEKSIASPEISPVALNEKACREFNITRKQRELLIILQRGYTYKRIAELLDVQEGTIKKQIGRIKEKTGLYYKKDILELFFPLA